MTNYLDRYAMRKRCGDCAFDPSSPAGQSPVTVATARLCVASGEPFYCHHGDGVRTDGDGEAVLCRGFVDAFVANGPVCDWKAAVASESLRMLEEVEAGRVISDAEFMERVIVAGERSQVESDL